MPGRRRDQHPVVGDVLDPPAGRAEREDVADPRLVDHLLVELADPPAGPLAADQEDAEQPAVGDGAAAGDGEPLGAGPAGERAGDAVPDDARAQLGELVGGVAAAEQVEGGVVRAARQLRRTARCGVTRSKRSSTDQASSAVAATTCWASTSSGLVGTRSDSIAPVRIRSTATAVWARSPRCLGNSTPRRHLADLVAGAADALEGAGDAGRRLDLDDQVDRAHVDAELEAAGRDHAGQPAALEVVLDERPLLLGHRAVVGLGDDRRCGVRRSPGLAITWAGGRPVGRRHGSTAGARRRRSR